MKSNNRPRKSAQARATGPRVGKSRPAKANNQRNRVLSRAKFKGGITPDGHFLRGEAR